MTRDVKIGLFLGLALVAGIGVWLATRPYLTASSRLRNMGPELSFSDEEPRFVTPLPQTTAAQSAADVNDYEPSARMEIRRFHIVRKGETLSSISQQYYGTAAGIQKILDANRIDNRDRIMPGTKLIIPD